MYRGIIILYSIYLWEKKESSIKTTTIRTKKILQYKLHEKCISFYNIYCIAGMLQYNNNIKIFIIIKIVIIYTHVFVCASKYLNKNKFK